MYIADRETRNDVFCQCCGEIADKETLNDDGECEECQELFCPICGQEHNAWHEFNAGYCQHCKEPILDYSTGEFFDFLKK